MSFAAPAFAEDFCLALVSYSNRVSAVPAFTITSEQYTAAGHESSLEYCYDHVSSQGYWSSSPEEADILGVRVANFDTSNHLPASHIQTWPLSSVSSQLTCSSGGGFTSGLAAIAGFLPQSPESVRIPNIISNMIAEGSLAAQMAIELYSGVWQYLAILTTFKMIKVFKP